MLASPNYQDLLLERKGAKACEFHYQGKGTRAQLEEEGTPLPSPYLSLPRLRGKTQSAGESLQQSDATLFHGGTSEYVREEARYYDDGGRMLPMPTTTTISLKPQVRVLSLLRVEELALQLTGAHSLSIPLTHVIFHFIFIPSLLPSVLRSLSANRRVGRGFRF